VPQDRRRATAAGASPHGRAIASLDDLSNGTGPPLLSRPPPDSRHDDWSGLADRSLFAVRSGNFTLADPTYARGRNN